ncbi:dihydropteroate synthase [Gallionella capsiferriformans]|jgi:dihydropteroate synthase|uniref:Dihydropteroate synthase n=1 Tax=Gallionella capsiferriformans (strain ES-2) TaxID=395494 RepID=D9SIU3_GALCS|nr:dihydropteroate synthase [Gallionella capsiferriformans]ADL56256.1 dihydropteroate synthase [Gallionella capsiferriformans ES-2]
MLSFGTFQFALSRPLVMGIVNVTPDSFSDGGRLGQSAIDHAHRLIEEGADIIDIGGESTRPGAVPVSIEDELSRVIPVIEALPGIPVSIDTFKPDVMRAAILAGAQMVNDIDALQNPLAMQIVAASNVAVCLMHKRGVPQTMQMQPEYEDVVAEVSAFLRERVMAARAAGIAQDRIVVDPGFGFGKTLAHNLALLRELHRFAALGVPVLAGLSRKSMLGSLTGQDAMSRMPASVAAAIIAVQRGAAIVRVHDVRATVDALKILNAINGGCNE